MIAVFTLALIAIFSYGISSALRDYELQFYLVEYMTKRNVPKEAIQGMLDALNKKHNTNTYTFCYDDTHHNNHEDFFGYAKYAMPWYIPFGSLSLGTDD